MTGAPASTGGVNWARGVETLERAMAPLFALGRDGIAREAGDEAVTYFNENGLLDPATRKPYLSETAYMARLVRPAGATVVDIGCGFGFMSLALAALGAKKVIGFDLKENRARGANRLAQVLGTGSRVDARYADFLQNPVPPGSADIVIANEVISHIRDLEGTLEGAARALAPGGRLYIRDANNRMHLGIYFARRKLYDKCELLGEHDFLPRDPEYARFSGKPYLEIRRTLLAEAFPDRRGEEIDRLARATKGLAGERLIQAGREILQNRHTSIRAAFPYADPITGYYPERWFDAFSLAGMVERAGFEVRILPPFDPHSRLGGTSRWMLRQAIDMASKFIPVHTLMFEQVLVLGTRKASPAAR